MKPFSPIYLKDYYVQGLPKNMPINRPRWMEQGPDASNPYNFKQFFADLRKYGKGWVIWQKYKEYHVHPQVAAYVKTLFRKIHGESIDNTGVEVFFFDGFMIKVPVFKEVFDSSYSNSKKDGE